MQTKRFKPITLKILIQIFMLFLNHRNSKNFPYTIVKNKVKFFLLLSSFRPFIKNIYNLNKFNKLMIMI